MGLEDLRGTVLQLPLVVTGLQSILGTYRWMARSAERPAGPGDRLGQLECVFHCGPKFRDNANAGYEIALDQSSSHPAQALRKFSEHPYRSLGAFRLFLATLVVVSHAEHLISPGLAALSLGNVGVLTFFVVSGFVIAEALDRFYARDPLRFLINRGLKIYPAYWAALVVAIILHAVAGAPLRTDNASVVGNVTLFLGYFPAFASLSWISITWAVIVELQFYVLAAFVIALGAAFRQMRKMVLVALIIALAGYVLVAATGGQSKFYGAFQFAPFFVLGVIAYFWISSRSAALGWTLAATAALTLHAFIAYVGRGEAHLFASTSIFAAVLLGFIVLATRPCPSNFRALDQRLGDLSYPVYLLHMPVIVWSASADQGFLTVAALTFLFALLVHWSVETPMKRFRTRVRGTRLS